MVRKPLKEQERITLKALVVIDVHARDVIGNLVEARIDTATAFLWVS